MADDPFKIAQPNLQAYEDLYREMNPSDAATVSAGDAASFLKKSGLPVATLGQIWELADYQKHGCLDKKGAFIALKLVAAAQQGLPISSQSISASGLDVPSLFSRTASPSIPQLSGSLNNQASISASQSSHLQSQSQPAHLQWVINQTDQKKYDSIFDSLAPQNGKLPGNKVRPVLLNSGLPGPTLAKIWELADQDKDGQLDRIEMSVALHLVYRALQNESVPSELPQNLIHPLKMSLSRKSSITSQGPSISHLGSSRIRTASLVSLEGAGLSGNFPLQPDSQRSFSVQPTMYARNGSLNGTPVHGISSTKDQSEWPIDINESASIFYNCDSNHDGLVSGADVREELLKTGALQHTLAHIWALSDMHATGTLNQEQFALVMYLISRHTSGEELPSTLPNNLVPPSLRQLSLNGGIRVSSDNISNSINGMQLSASNLSLGIAAESDDPEVRQLVEEMDRLVCEKRETEANIAQLEADMTVKNSEIRNLQIELATLESTVKQLDRQKSEAGKRLGDLDDQICKLDEQCSQQLQKVTEASLRLENMKKETDEGASNSQKNAQLLSSTRAELASLDSESRALSAELLQEQRGMELTVDQLTRLERDSEKMVKSLGIIRSETTRAHELGEQLKTVLSSETAVDQLTSQPDLFEQFKTLDMLDAASFGGPSTSQVPVPFRPPAPLSNSALSSNNFAPSFGSSQTTAVINQNSSSGDPFGSNYVPPPLVSDPFVGKDPFSVAPSEGNFAGAFPSDPFSASNAGSKESTPKSLPPRPAPPTSTQPDPFAGSDPFGSSAPPNQQNGTGGFADFANFGAF